jgi:protein TonB
MPATQLKIAWLVSALIHAGSLAGLLWLPIGSPQIQVQFSVARGTSATDQAASAAAQPVPVQISPVLPEADATPQEPLITDAEPIQVPPTETPVPGIDRLAIHKQETGSLDRLDRAETPIDLEVTPPPVAHPEFPLHDDDHQPATPAEIAKQLPRRPTAEPNVEMQEVVALPQLAAIAGADVDQVPSKLANNPAPHYPASALIAGVEGRVILRVLVRPDGLVEWAEVNSTSGSASLDESALGTVRRWRFTPARRGGQPVTFEVLVPVRFSIFRG